MPLPLSEYAMDLAASRVRHCSSIARIELIHYRRAPSHSPNGGVPDSLDEANAAFRGGGGARLILFELTPARVLSA